MPAANEMITPMRCWTGAEVLAAPSPIPMEPGIWGWYFKSIPTGVPPEGRIRRHGPTPPYATISPMPPPEGPAVELRSLSLCPLAFSMDCLHIFVTAFEIESDPELS